MPVFRHIQTIHAPLCVRTIALKASDASDMNLRPVRSSPQARRLSFMSDVWSLNFFQSADSWAALFGGNQLRRFDLPRASTCSSRRLQP